MMKTKQDGNIDDDAAGAHQSHHLSVVHRRLRAAVTTATTAGGHGGGGPLVVNKRMKNRQTTRRAPRARDDAPPLLAPSLLILLGLLSCPVRARAAALARCCLLRREVILRYCSWSYSHYAAPPRSHRTAPLLLFSRAAVISLIVFSSSAQWLDSISCGSACIHIPQALGFAGVRRC